MKTFLLICILLSILLMSTGCTMQFKAKEIELEGHSNTTYEFTGFAWTEQPADLPAPAD